MTEEIATEMLNRCIREKDYSHAIGYHQYQTVTELKQRIADERVVINSCVAKGTDVNRHIRLILKQKRESIEKWILSEKDEKILEMFYDNAGTIVRHINAKEGIYYDWAHEKYAVYKANAYRLILRKKRNPDKSIKEVYIASFYPIKKQRESPS